MKFDAYCATIPARPEIIIHSLLEAFAGQGMRVERRRSTLRYAHADMLLDAMDEQFCTVHHGGDNGLPHVRAQGGRSPDLADALRRLWPEHRVSRADVALDFDGPGCWDKLFGACDQVARACGLTWRTIGDFREDRDELAGRSAYVASRQSSVMARLYEKGKQLLPFRRVGDPPLSLDWCRLEIEVKPQPPAMKLAASKWTAEQFWGCAFWSRKLLHSACGLDVERIKMTVRKETDARRSIRHMAVQYRSPMEVVRAEEGGDAGFMRFIHGLWHEQDNEGLHYTTRSQPEPPGGMTKLARSRVGEM